MTDGVVDRLLAAMSRAAGTELRWAKPPEPLSGGFWAEMWRVWVDGADELHGPLVARVMPDPAVAARETAVQTHLARHGFSTPAVRLAAPPGPDLDRAWMIMDHVDGQPMLAGLSGFRALLDVRRLLRELPLRLADRTAALHTVEPAHLRTEVGADLLERMHDVVLDMGRPDLAATAEALAADRPEPGRIAVCHGDLHPFNVLSGPAGDVLIDWSTTQVTDPAYDVAFTRLIFDHPPLATPAPLRPLVAAFGRTLSTRFADAYDRLAPAPIAPRQLKWYGDFHAYRILVEVAGWETDGSAADRSGHPFAQLAPIMRARLEHRRRNPGSARPSA